MLTKMIIRLSVVVAAAMILLRCTIGQSIVIFLLSYVVQLLLLILLLLIAYVRVDRSKPVEKPSAFCRYCCECIASLMNLFGLVRIRTSGLELLPENKRFLIVANHSAATDPAVMIQELKNHQVAFISKPSNMEIPLAGKVAYGAGYLPIDRENDRNALKTILAAANYLKKDVASVCVYPEGTRSRDGELLPFHAGTFKIAQRAGVPLVISCLVGTEQVKHNLKRLRSTNVRFDILEVLDEERVSAMSTGELAEYSRRRIQAHLEACRKGAD